MEVLHTDNDCVLVRGTIQIGDSEEEILVEVNPSDLVTLGLTAQDLARQVQQSDAKVAAGQLRSPDMAFSQGNNPKTIL